jgi:hypothetical protein
MQAHRWEVLFFSGGNVWKSDTPIWMVKRPCFKNLSIIRFGSEPKTYRVSLHLTLISCPNNQRIVESFVAMFKDETQEIEGKCAVEEAKR